MPSCTASISVAAPVESVWRVLAAVVAWPEWLPNVNSVEPLDDDQLSVGFRYVVRQPGLRPATWVVSELEPPRRFVWQTRSPGLLMVAEHSIKERAVGVSEVALRFSFRGLLGVPVGKLFGRITQQYLLQEVASLAQG